MILKKFQLLDSDGVLEKTDNTRSFSHLLLLLVWDFGCVWILLESKSGEHGRTDTVDRCPTLQIIDTEHVAEAIADGPAKISVLRTRRCSQVVHNIPNSNLVFVYSVMETRKLSLRIMKYVYDFTLYCTWCFPSDSIVLGSFVLHSPRYCCCVCSGANCLLYLWSSALEFDSWWWFLSIAEFN